MLGPVRGHFSRSRSLEDFEKKFNPHIIENTLEEIIKRGLQVRVLEIGYGEGRVLMQLRKMFPNIELYGINKKPWPAMKGRKSLLQTARYYKIFNRNELKKIKLPSIQFYNARKLRFKDCYFDLVISQVSIQYVDRKDTLLEDIWRVLKQGGKAFLNIDSRQDPCPDFLDYETPRFVIYKQGKVFPIKNLVAELRTEGYDISYKQSVDTESGITKRRSNIIYCKNTPKSLKLNLEFDEVSSFDLSLLNKEKGNWSIYWGYRSVYTIAS